jgi:hypothetical protein
MARKMLKIADSVAECILSIFQQPVKPILDGLAVAQPLKAEKPPVPLLVSHDSTKLAYINKNIK